MRKHLCVLAVLLLASTPIALAGFGTPSIGNYRAKIDLNGTVTLKGFWSSNETTIHIETSFTELIPKTIAPGSYADVMFQGSASFHTMKDVRDSNLEFTGMLKIDDFNLLVSFRVKVDSVDLKELKYSANGTLNVAISEFSKEFPGVKVYPAMISVSGILNLKSYLNQSLSADVNVEVNFTATVPIAVEPGTYNGSFLGTAIVFSKAVKFGGVINVDGYNFWVRFLSDKGELTLPDGFYSASGNLQVTITEIPYEELGVTWVMMRGNITQYGEEKAYGKLLAHGKIGEWFNVFGCFYVGQEPPVPIIDEGDTLSLYQFKMKNYTTVELNYEGKALYVEGYWDVYNVTLSYFDDEFTCTKTLIVDDGYGELNVTLNSETGNFTLNIDGIHEISGAVAFYHVKYSKTPAQKRYMFGVSLADVNGDWKINIDDVLYIAKSFGSMIGRRGYNFDVDFNLDFQVNILDLYEISKDFGKEY